MNRPLPKGLKKIRKEEFVKEMLGRSLNKENKTNAIEKECVEWLKINEKKETKKIFRW